MSETKGSNLIAGCDLISRKLRYCLSPFGWLYKFDQGRPKPLSLLVVLSICATPIFIFLIELGINGLLRETRTQHEEFKALSASTFVLRLYKVVRIYRYVTCVGILLLTLAQHSSIANVIASSNNFVSIKEQQHFGRLAFAIFLLKVCLMCTSFIAIIAFQLIQSDLTLLVVWSMSIIFLVFISAMNLSSQMVYTCYLGSSLGKHVENFSKTYVDTMFDQFMKAIEKEGDEAGTSSGPAHRLALFDTSSETSADDLHPNRDQKGFLPKHCCALGGFICSVWRYILRTLISILSTMRNIFARLNETKYPELPEMKMTKLSSTTNIQISETMRMANSHLIRVRLRRTQVMLSELRDVVTDINKASSPVVLLFLAYETILIILITTASIQAKVYKSIDLLIIPTITTTISLVTSVVYICTCLDETTKQLKLLINKLFDFIIMNHQVQTSNKRSSAQTQTNLSEVCMIPGSETGAINETWSQFQYTRKLANTIHFTMGRIFPVTRRLVLSILGHILSAVFISIEIMSIIDTQNTAHRHHDSHVASSNVSMQHNLKGSH